MSTDVIAITDVIISNMAALEGDYFLVGGALMSGIRDLVRDPRGAGPDQRWEPRTQRLLHGGRQLFIDLFPGYLPRCTVAGS